jgi:hypothetical protein
MKILLGCVAVAVLSGALLLVQPWASRAKPVVGAACIDPFDTSALLRNPGTETAKPETEIPLPEALSL